MGLSYQRSALDAIIIRGFGSSPGGHVQCDTSRQQYSGTICPGGSEAKGYASSPGTIGRPNKAATEYHARLYHDSRLCPRLFWVFWER